MTKNENAVVVPISESELALQRQLWAEVIRKYEESLEDNEGDSK